MNRNRVLTILAFVSLCGSMFMRSFDPIIPDIAEGLHVLPSTAALLSTAFALPFALVQPVLGALADMFSKPLLMLICLGLLSVATLAGSLVDNFELLLITRMIAGIGSGGLVPIAFAFVGDLVPVQDRQVAMGRLLFAIMTGNLLGATGAGVVADLFGWREVFTAMSVLGFVILVVAFFGFRGLGSKGGGFDLSQTLPNYRAIFRNPLAKFCFITVVVEAMFMYGLFPHLASLLQNVGEARASIAGIIIAGFGLGGAIYSLRVAWLLKRLGERWMMRLGGIVMGACIAFVAVRPLWPVQVVDFMALGLAFYMLHAVVQIYASELAPAARGSAMALHSFFFFMGQAVGPVFYKYGFAHVGIAPVLCFAGVMLALTGLMCGHYLRRGAT
ncbi:MFS transporter [Pseudolabrys sp.]|uniref:MFS transporter n=1 Tax=Pseudolabrys sp. TaxID=1960880 RepID=UPI003D13C778